jgi:hypothetical protein
MLSFVSADTPYVFVAAALAVLGAGMGVTAAPATGEIMSAVPLDKAGVGSAVNDTTRELGGALGIAILGSVANAAYRAHVSLSGIGLPAGARHQGETSIGAAAQIASSVPGGDVVKAHAAAAFSDAFNLASLVSAGIVVVLAAGLLFMARNRGGETVDDLLEFADEPELDLALVPVGAGEEREWSDGGDRAGSAR